MRHSLLVLGLFFAAVGCGSTKESPEPEDAPEAQKPLGEEAQADPNEQLQRDARAQELSAQQRTLLLEQHLSNGERLLEEARVDEAMREAEAALALDPESPRARDLQARVAALRDAPIARDIEVAANAASTDWTQPELERIAAEIRGQIEVLRGERFTKAVQVKLADVNGLHDYVRSRETETTTPARLARDECVLKLLGLLKPDFDLRAAEEKLLAGQVGGFYDPKTDTFSLMQGLPSGVARVILAHELTHALDDQLHDLDLSLKLADEQTDRELVFRAIAEGSGSNAMNRWMKEHGATLSASDVAFIQGMGAEELRAAPPCLWKPLLFSYLGGEAFLLRRPGLNLTMKGAANEDIKRAFKHPPRSTEQVLHPEKYWDKEKLDVPMLIGVSTEMPTPGLGWSLAGEDTLGEMALSLVTTPIEERTGIDPSNALALMGMRYTNKAAEGWGGDRLVLLARGEDRFLQLVTSWDMEKDADEFAAAIKEVAPALAPDERGKGFRPGWTPTGWSVRRADELTVVLRAWSVRDPEDRSVNTVELHWSSMKPLGER